MSNFSGSYHLEFPSLIIFWFGLLLLLHQDLFYRAVLHAKDIQALTNNRFALAVKRIDTCHTISDSTDFIHGLYVLIA